MKTPDDINMLLAEVGPLDETILAVVRGADDRWAIRFDQTDVEAEYDEPTGRLMLSTDLGAPPPLRAAKVYEAVLTYGSLWRDTGGVRIALSRPGGELLQMAELAAADLTPAVLVTVAVNLQARTAFWRDFVSGEDDGGTADEPVAQEFPFEAMIRV